jgi:hypothetical protein
MTKEIVKRIEALRYEQFLLVKSICEHGEKNNLSSSIDWTQSPLALVIREVIKSRFIF